MYFDKYDNYNEKKSCWIGLAYARKKKKNFQKKTTGVTQQFQSQSQVEYFQPIIVHPVPTNQLSWQLWMRLS